MHRKPIITQAEAEVQGARKLGNFPASFASLRKLDKQRSKGAKGAQINPIQLEVVSYLWV